MLVLNNISATFKIIKKNSMIWMFPLLLMPILLFINKDPVAILDSFLMNIGNYIYCCKLLLEVIGAFATITIVLIIVFLVIKRVFQESQQTFLASVKAYYLPVLVLVSVKLILLNCIIDFFVGWFRFCELLWVFWNYSLLYIINIFLFFVLHSVIDSTYTGNESFVARIKGLFSLKILIQLLIMVVLASLISIPIMHYPKNKLFQPEPINLTYLRVLFSSLVHTFLIIYTAVLYYGRKGHSFAIKKVGPTIKR